MSCYSFREHQTNQKALKSRDSDSYKIKTFLIHLPPDTNKQTPTRVFEPQAQTHV